MKSQHLAELIVFVSFLIRLSCSDSSYVTPRLKPHLRVQDITINDFAGIKVLVHFDIYALHL